ncbi:uncharacterized protein LOC121773632 [Salvia splendens]|uniref:uncharacterized protein LOC121773632 n=1 Tax=Salvia splendens TaxID=180675 RepID=UPI001C25B29B|nr:uncharacterized protein LOC121773632 [Salvia splendens]
MSGRAAVSAIDLVHGSGILNRLLRKSESVFEKSVGCPSHCGCSKEAEAVKLFQKMSRRAAVSAIDLVHGRGFFNLCSNKTGILSPPLSLFSSKAFQPKRRTIDFSSVKELDDAVKLWKNEEYAA